MPLFIFSQVSGEIKMDADVYGIFVDEGMSLQVYIPSVALRTFSTAPEQPEQCILTSNL